MIRSDKMRLFVNIELPSWQTAVHLTTCSRLYSGKWWDYHIYNVKGFDNDGKLHLVSFSSIESLKKLAFNSTDFDKYYCYYGYRRWPIYEGGNYTLTRVKLHGPIDYDDVSPLIKVPSIIEHGDRLVIYDPSQGNASNPITGLFGVKGGNNMPELA